MTEAELRNEIKTGLSGVYLLAGEEEYLKRHYLLRMRESVLSEEGFESFNHTVADFTDGGFGSLINDVATAPFMQEKRLCELVSFNFNSAKENQLKALSEIVREAMANDECVFIIYADVDMYDTSRNSRTQAKVSSALGDGVKTIVFEKSTPQKLAVWIKRHVEHEGLRIADADCAFIIERCGRSMQMLSGEIEKLCAYKHAKGEDTISRGDIVYITSKVEEIGAFALANAVLAGDTKELFRVLGEYKRGDSDMKPKGVLSAVCSVYSMLILIKEMLAGGYDEAGIAKKLKKHEYQIKLYARTAKNIPTQKLERAMELCVEADSEMKLGFSDFIALERLLCTVAAECR